MIISQMYNGIATGNVEEGAKIFTERFGYKIKHRLIATGCKIYIMENLVFVKTTFFIVLDSRLL